MAASPVPLVVATDPKEIFIADLKMAKDVNICVLPVGQVSSFAGDCLLFGVSAAPENASASLTADVAEFDKTKCAGLLKETIEHEEFKAEMGSTCCVRVAAPRNVAMICAVGVGGLSALTAGKCGAGIAACIREHPTCVRVGVYVPMSIVRAQCEAEGGDVSSSMQSLIEGILLNVHLDVRFKGQGHKNSKASRLESLTFFTEDVDALQTSLDCAKQIAQGVDFCRQLVNAPANFCNTISLANAAIQMAKEVGLKAKVLGVPEIEALSMGSYLAVAKGSMYPPRFLHLTYSPKGPVRRRVAFVGKGLCFDSGGYNIKNMACGIELMKFDMGGCATVLGAAKSIGLIQPEGVEIHFISALAENMVSKEAYRPGDVITASNGKTIEVGNTDAEGRLTLADALVYADLLGVDEIVDVATLTGAVVVALGNAYAGLWSPQNSLADKLLKSASSSGEKLWRMPLALEYKELLESKCADINNIGGKGSGGAITAAVFLNEFVEKTPWAHIDIAGTCWDSKAASATGYGTRTLVNFAMQRTS